jgi:hypothetical protein
VKTKVRNALLLRFADPVFQSDDNVIDRADKYDKNGTKGQKTGECQ